MSQILADLNRHSFDDLEDFEELPFPNEIFVAMESLQAIQSGLQKCKPADFQNPRTMANLRTHISNLHEATGVSLEGLDLTYPEIQELTVSQEGAVTEVISSFIAKIIEFLEKVASWLHNCFRRLFGKKPVILATAKASNMKIAAAEQRAARNQKDIVDTVVLTVPGNCYLAFHSSKHKPKAGFVYNDDGIAKALDQIANDWDRLIGIVGADIRSLISLGNRVDAAIQKPTSAATTISLGLKDYKLNREMFGLSHDKFSTTGMGVLTKPLRRANEHHQVKFSLTNVTGELGWAGADNFDITVSVSKVKSINDAIIAGATKQMTDIGKLINLLESSKIVKDLPKTLKVRRSTLGMLQPDSTDHENNQKILSGLEIVVEYLNQMVDNIGLMANFYGRYLQTWAIITTKLANAVEQSAQ